MRLEAHVGGGKHHDAPPAPSELAAASMQQGQGNDDGDPKGK